MSTLFQYLLLIVLLFPPSIPLFDMGPKPTMEFSIIYDDDKTIAIEEIQLFICNDENCTDGQYLEKEWGPQGISCESNTHCSSMAYGYGDFHILEIEFSDGITRQSNIFSKTHFDEKYEVIVQEEDLVINSKGGKINPMGAIVFGAIGGSCLFALLLIGLLIILILSILNESKTLFSESKTRWLTYATWAICMPLIAVSSIFYLEIVFTVIIELVVVVVLSYLLKTDIWKILTTTILANTVTLIALFGIVQWPNADYSIILLILLELVIFIAETFIYYLNNKQSLTIKQAMIYSLSANILSFIAGLFISI